MPPQSCLVEPGWHFSHKAIGMQ